MPASLLNVKPLSLANSHLQKPCCVLIKSSLYENPSDLCWFKWYTFPPSYPYWKQGLSFLFICPRRLHVIILELFLFGELCRLHTNTITQSHNQRDQVISVWEWKYNTTVAKVSTEFGIGEWRRRKPLHVKAYWSYCGCITPDWSKSSSLFRAVDSS